MVDSNQALLLGKSGHDVHWWAERGHSAGVKSDTELREWMRTEHGITGYAQHAVSWEMFGYPEFMLRDADEVLDGQYRAPRTCGPLPTPSWHGPQPVRAWRSRCANWERLKAVKVSA